MRNHPARASRLPRFLQLTAAAVGLSVGLAAVVRADRPGDENKALRPENRELQARPADLDAAKAAAKGHEAGGAVSLIHGKDLSGWRTVDEKAKDHWKVVGEAKIDPEHNNKLVGSGDPGEHPVMILEQATHGADIYTDQKFGDCEVHVELMVPKGSNSGVYLMGEYEVQVLDSFGKEKVGPGDLGGIYNTKAPTENAAKAPGEWQTFDIVFQAPRFEGGKKTQNAKFVLVKVNGKTVHENVDAPKPTGSELPGGERPEGPLMLQGDHGSVAFRNITVKPIAIRDGK